MRARNPANDARKLKPEQQEEVRRRVIASIQEGTTPEEAARVFGVSLRSIFHWIARYRSGGWSALKTGARSGRPRKLDARAMKWVYNTVRLKNPLQLEFPFALWTREMVREAIKRKFKVILSVSSVGRLLRQMGLSVQRPLWRAWQQDPQAVRRWKTYEFPRIRNLAKRMGAKVFFQDESGVRSDYHAGTTWAKRGETPVVETTGARFSLNMISAISPRGELRFMVVDGTVNSAVFCQFLDRLMHNEPGHVFLILDGHPTHKAKAVSKHLEKFAGRLRLYFLPPYSPELNPDEHVWGWAKAQQIGKRVYSSKAELRAIITSTLRSLQRRVPTLLGFFRAPDLAYIAM